MTIITAPTMAKRDNSVSSHDKLVIILSIIFGIVGVSVIGFAGLEFWRKRRIRALSKRGLTPIGDEEIATWKGAAEEFTPPFGHASKDSMGSAKIQYQFGGYRQSSEVAQSPRSFIHNNVSGLPKIPEPAAFALAPNARTGLTDETVPGADPFIAPLRRQPSRLQKFIPSTPKSVARANSLPRGSWSHNQPEKWNSADSSLASSPEFNPLGRTRVYSLSPIPLNDYPDDEHDIRTELTPPPSRRGPQ